MRPVTILLIFVCAPMLLKAQTATYVPPSNRTYAGLEKNLLFFANTRYTVTQTGTAVLELPVLFDGKYAPSYSATAPSSTSPTVITIENLPEIHTQTVAYVGWTTRHYTPASFKIEGYNVYSGANAWVVFADVTNNSIQSYSASIPSGTYTKLRFTFSEGNPVNGLLGVSELFFLHGEATQVYDDLLVKYDGTGNVRMGTNERPSKLSVNGDIVAKKVRVTQAGWADFVFADDYDLPSLMELESYIKANRHLPEIPTEHDIAVQGHDVGEMNRKLLQKIEELTLYLIEEHKNNKVLAEKVKQLSGEVKRMKENRSKE